MWDDSDLQYVHHTVYVPTYLLHDALSWVWWGGDSQPTPSPPFLSERGKKGSPSTVMHTHTSCMSISSSLDDYFVWVLTTPLTLRFGLRSPARAHVTQWQKVLLPCCLNLVSSFQCGGGASSFSSATRSRDTREGKFASTPPWTCVDSVFFGASQSRQ